jgi:hypothetical protein
MADMNCLLAALLVAALAIGIGFWVGLVSKLLLSKLLLVLGWIALAMIDLLSIAGATWLLFRRLQPQYTRRDAKAAATAFVLLSPIMIAAAVFFAGKLMFYLSFDLRLPGPLALAGGGISGIVLAVSLLGFFFCATAIGWARLFYRTP